VDVHAGGSLAGKESSDACSTSWLIASSTCAGADDRDDFRTPPRNGRAMAPTRPETMRLAF
jgi:hypothetical protein